MTLQNSETMEFMMRDFIQYIIIPRWRYAPELGTYVSYDIAAFDSQWLAIVSVLQDVTTDRDLALRMTERFNRAQLAPCHLKEAVLDMLS